MVISNTYYLSFTLFTCNVLKYYQRLNVNGVNLRCGLLMCKVVMAGLIIFGALVASPAEAVFADTEKVFSVFTENADKAETSGFALGLRKVDRNDLYMQFGLSYQRITLKQQPADYSEGRIRPVFLYARLGMDWWLSPYFQAGFDLSGSLLEWIENDSNSNNCCHGMAKVGLELKLQPNIRLDFYGNYYNLQYQSFYPNSLPIDYQVNGDNRRFSRTTIGAQLSLLF